MLRRSLAQLETAGLELVGGLAVLGLSAWAFGWIVEELAEGDTAHLDSGLAEWLHGRATPWLTEFFEAVTVLGNGPVLVAVAALAAVYAAWRRTTAELALVVLALVGSEVLVLGLKLGFRRDRPFFPDPLATETSFSFPSGHATVSMAVYGAVALLVARRLAGWRAPSTVLALGALLVWLIGFSRLYLGVHYLSDVVAGFSLGLAWLALCVVALHLHERRPILRSFRRQTSR